MSTRRRKRLCQSQFGLSGERNARRRAGGADALVGVSLEPLEIVAEHLHQTPRNFRELALVAPGLDRLENVRLDAGNLLRHGETEVRIGAEISAMQRTVKRGRHQPSRHPNRHAPSGAELAAGPSGIDEPTIDMVPRDQIAQKIAVNSRMQRQERRAETGRKRRLRLGHALLGTRNLGGVAGEEMIHRLRRIELGDRRQHAERVAGQHDDVFGMTGAARR